MTSPTRLLAALIAAAAIAVPASAFAQTGASDASAPPSYARPSYGSDEDVVKGQVVAFDGGYNLQVRDDRGFIDNVVLHQGTIINPTGLRLSPGMTVTVRGVNRGHALDANQIDTPYTTYGAVPVYPVAVAPYYAYPYGAYPAYGFGYGYGYGYGYGPGLSIGIGIGPAYGWGRGGYFGGFHGRWR
jgi:hypothetical protein